MINSKDKGRRAEYEYRDLIRKIFGTKTERMPMSGAIPGWKGDLRKETLPKILKEYPPEIKYEVKPRILAYIRQCQEEFNSKTGWHIAYRCPAELNIPYNFVVVIPAIELLGLLKELQDFRDKKEEK